MNLDVFSDAICPWCWIGKRRLAAALTDPELAEVRVTWRAFQLYPEIPLQGMERDAFMRARFGDEHGSAGGRGGVYERLEAEGESVGIRFDFGAIRRMPNTLHAHRLIHHAHASGRQNEVVEALFEAYFCQGADLADLDTLVAAADTGGLDTEAARSWLVSDAGGEAVGQQIVWARNNGITGVPCYVLPNGFGVPGAQDPDTLKRFFRRGLELASEAELAPDYSIVDATAQPLG